MRSLSKAFVVTVGLLAIGALSSSVRANNLLIGAFTLPHPTQWNNTVLPAGDYTFKLARTQSNTNLLSVRGATKTLEILVFAQSACETCQGGALKVAVQGDNRNVTSLDLPGFHVNFKAHESAAEKAERLAKTSSPSEQVAVRVGSN
jgi:hypothetical protein